MTKVIRCPWCGDDPLYIAYHDEEWGVRVHDDRKLFEFLTLEGAQAGLSWITILRKRENYRNIFHEWDIQEIAEMSDTALEALLLDPGVIRNRLKIYSVRKNARVALDIIREFGGLDVYFSSFFPEIPLISRPSSLSELPTRDHYSDAISKDLKKRGMSFVGSTIIFAFLQAVGYRDDHMIDCFRATSSKTP